ncbi:FAD-dependent oxidoreductase [Patescibacteria group bacterium]|nr:MAG: FAD-dependent oxidoreductase [Patescibacteria group bacterium]
MPQRIAVIGAGIAGLSCATDLRKAGFDVVVFEKNGYVGGRMSSRSKDGFIFDLGADHLCDLYDGIKDACREFGVGWEKMRFLKYGIVKGGKVISPEAALGPLSKLRLAAQQALMRDVGDFLWLDDLAIHDHANAYDYMRVRAGREVSDYFVDAFSTTYQFHRAREISLGALLGIMQSIQKDKDRWHLHRTAGGMQALPDAMAARLPDVRLNAAVSAVTGGEQVRVFVDGSEDAFDAVVVAAPAPSIAALYKNPTAAQRDILAGSRFAATISVSFRVRRALLPDTAVVWVPYVESEKICGYVNEAMKGDDALQDGDTLLNLWLHEDFARQIMDKSDAEIFAAVKKAFLPICPWVSSPADVREHDLERWPLAMPKFAHGHLRAVKTFMEHGQGGQNVFFAGDWLNSPWTEGALRCGKRVAAQVSARFSPPEADQPLAEAAPR